MMPKISARIFKAHIEDLLERYNIGWCTFPSGRGYTGLAIPELREIETPEIKGRLSYATALHEIGHIVGPYSHPRYKTMMKEIGAWKWARRNALIWSPGMEKHAQECLAWYATITPYGTNAAIQDRKREARDRLNMLAMMDWDDETDDDA